MIKVKSKYIVNEFKASNGLIEAFPLRYDIMFCIFHDELISADPGFGKLIETGIK